jgi:tetratricopeptide (TPR) repeat protein
MQMKAKEEMNIQNENADDYDYDHAIVDCTEAIRLDPNDAEAYKERGNAYFSKRDYDHAIADCTEAIRLGLLSPDYDLPYVLRAWAYLGKEDYDQAIADYTEVLRIDPQNDFVREKLEEIQQEHDWTHK